MVKRLLFTQKVNPCEHTGLVFFFFFCFKKYAEPGPCQWPLETPLVTFQERTDQKQAGRSLDASAACGRRYSPKCDAYIWMKRPACATVLGITAA